MKQLLLVFTFLALLASCTVPVQPEDNTAPEFGSSKDAVDFGAYVNRGVITKAGAVGDLDITKLRDGDVGFGVFCYYGNGALYNETSKPDFMYNQHVAFTSNSVWEYSPIKYWPNEYGAEAGSESVDRLTFFAYAPFVAVTSSTGVPVTNEGEEMGILGMTRNIAEGDPMVMYGSCLQPGGGVDLCWGVAAEDFTSSVDGNKNHVSKGSPYINVIKPKVGDKIAFEFNHALTQLNVKIDADIDVESHAASTLDNNTRVYVRSVTFTGFTTKGSLNLNSKVGNPSWFDLSCTGRLRRDPVTVFDGRSDGMEGSTSAIDVNESPAVLSPIIVQSRIFGEETATSSRGVTNEAVNLFSFADPNNPIAEVDAPVMVIPITGIPVTVTIVYDIETKDDNLSSYLSDGVTRGLSVENIITKTIQIGGQSLLLESGKRYVIGLHLGLTSVKFDAAISSWDNTPYYGKVDLPVNTTSLGSISITDAITGSELTEATIWKNEGFNKPTVKVLGADGSDLTDLSTISWESSKESVAKVATDGTVTVLSTGTTTIKMTATYNDKSASKSYTLSVNDVTGIELSPVTSSIVAGGNLSVTASLKINGGIGINGTITSWPTVSWSSDYEKVTVSPTSTTATDEGTDVVSNTTVTAAGNAESEHKAVIKATVGYPYANPDVSAISTLTCQSKVTIASVILSATELTTWAGQGAAASAVTSVTGSDGSELKESPLLSISWSSSNTAVAIVDESSGAISLAGTGTAYIKATATLQNSETTAYSQAVGVYTVHVNGVTGIAVAPSSDNIYIDGSLPLTATLVYNEGNAINGNPQEWPVVTWTSYYDKVTVTPASSTATAAGTTSTTAAAVTGAAAGSQAVITASVTGPYISGPQTASATLTCADKVTIQSVVLDNTSATVWKYDGASAPTVTVTGSDGNTLTEGVTLSWEVKEGTSASVTTGGTITLNSSGTTTLKVTATLAASETTAADSESAEFVINVNEVTGISVMPASATILPGGTVTLTATLTNTGYGDVTSLTAPAINWVSGTPAYVTISSATGASTVATGVATGGSSVVTTTVDANYVQSGAPGSATATITCSNATSGTGTGYTGGWN